MQRGAETAPSGGSARPERAPRSTRPILGGRAAGRRSGLVPPPPAAPPRPSLLSLWWPALVGCLVAALVAAVHLYTRNRPELGWRFAQPWVLLLLGLIPVVVQWSHLRERRGHRATFVFSQAEALKRIPPSLWARLRGAPLALRAMALALLVAAAARPQSATLPDAVEVEGLDIVMVLDLSGSMRAQDLSPDRLGAAKRVLEDFVRRRKTDRLGLVVFGKEAFTYCPLTTDYNVLQNLIRRIHHGLVDGQGTAIGNAVGVAINRLRKSDAKSKVVVLITDGDSNRGNISPRQAAEFARTLGIKIFTVLVGQNDAAPVPAQGPFGQEVKVMQKFPVNPKLLEEMAAMTGGQAMVATDDRALQERFHALLATLDKSRIRDVATTYAEQYRMLCALALLLLSLEAALAFGRLRKFP
jgi:Ca-activated chloride channel family protein